MENPDHLASVALPRVAITFCTQCRWMLRAAYFGQELLSTFGTSIGEIALVPATGGKFVVNLTYKPHVAAEDGSTEPSVQDVTIWDYKTERCFPETKILKQKIRNFIDPEKSLGHSDTPSSKAKATRATTDVANENAVVVPSPTPPATGTIPSADTLSAPSISSAVPNTGTAHESKESGQEACQDCI